MKTIFVSIASYRDPDIQNTIDDLFKKATSPMRVIVGVYLQVHSSDTDCKVKKQDNVRVITVPPSQARGAGWARSNVISLMKGEDYFFQIDSHMRFVANWDTKLIDMLTNCPSPKSVLSTYPLEFTPPNTLHEDMYVTIKSGSFNEDGVFIQASSMVPFAKNQKLVKNPFIAGGMIFAKSSMVVDVPIDENLFFEGEEISYGLRLYTPGYDVYVPNMAIAYHDYTPSTRPRVWENKTVKRSTLMADSKQRVLWLCSSIPPLDNSCLKDIEKYGLGEERTLAQYEEFANINFKEKIANTKSKAKALLEQCSFNKSNITIRL